MWTRLKEGLRKTSQRVTQGISQLFHKNKDIDWEAFSDVLIEADMGAQTTQTIILELKKQKFSDSASVNQFLKDYLVQQLRPLEKKLPAPELMLVIGVNGSGKTTFLGKLAHLWKTERLHYVAADTFRVGAKEQLSRQIGEFPITYEGKDPSTVIYKGLQSAKEQGDTVVLIDTAGRLPNKPDLMHELKKTYQTILKQRPETPCEIILVLDTSLGQHARTQLEIFSQCLPITGLVLTKLDSGAKGGILVSLAESHPLPVYFISTGEAKDQLHVFQAEDFVEAILGQEANS